MALDSLVEKRRVMQGGGQAIIQIGRHAGRQADRQASRWVGRHTEMEDRNIVPINVVMTC